MEGCGLLQGGLMLKPVLEASTVKPTSNRMQKKRMGAAIVSDFNSMRA